MKRFHMLMICHEMTSTQVLNSSAILHWILFIRGSRYHLDTKKLLDTCLVRKFETKMVLRLLYVHHSCMIGGQPLISM